MAQKKNSFDRDPELVSMKSLRIWLAISVTDFVEEKIILGLNDYFYSNVIARASKTMAECRRIQNKEYKDGTNN